MLESPSNYEQKSICCFLVDTSGSMQGSKIQALNAGLKQFYQDIITDSVVSNRLEVAIVEFNNTARLRVSPGLAENISIPELKADGGTDLQRGVELAIDTINKRKEYYRETGQPYLRPWIILITDGEPDKENDINDIKRMINKGVDNKNFIFLPIGVKDANLDVLSEISHLSYPPMKLEGLKFSEFFRWVSASMCIVSASSEEDIINLPSTNNWLEGYKI
jgi:uncharacterized protein YegL